MVIIVKHFFAIVIPLGTRGLNWIRLFRTLKLNFSGTRISPLNLLGKVVSLVMFSVKVLIQGNPCYSAISHASQGGIGFFRGLGQKYCKSHCTAVRTCGLKCLNTIFRVPIGLHCITMAATFQTFLNLYRLLPFFPIGQNCRPKVWNCMRDQFVQWPNLKLLLSVFPKYGVFRIRFSSKL